MNEASRAARGVPLVVLAAMSLLLAGCETLVEDLADKSDPGHVGARAHTLRDVDAYGNEIPPKGK